ncbi:MAG: hypothetical protein WB462_08690, partial [Solirubrobacterales bacterium]
VEGPQPRPLDHWRHHADRLLCICLASGGARHLIDGKTRLKDFDVYCVFAALLERGSHCWNSSSRI